MRRLRLAVASAVLVATLGILATPWVQVVEENTRTETFSYLTTHTYPQTHVSTVTTISTTGYATILDRNNIVARGMGIGEHRYEPAWWSKHFKLGWNQTLKIEFRLGSSMSCPPDRRCLYLTLWRVWNYPYPYDMEREPVVDIFRKEGGFQITDSRRHYDPENFVAPLPSGCSLGQPCTFLHYAQPPGEEWWYVISAGNDGDDPVYFDLKITTPQITKTTYVTTSVENAPEPQQTVL